jgi:hypothetical protein
VAAVVASSAISAVGTGVVVGKGIVAVGGGSASVTTGGEVDVGDEVTVVSDVVEALQAVRRMQIQMMVVANLRFICHCTRVGIELMSVVGVRPLPSILLQ